MRRPTFIDYWDAALDDPEPDDYMTWHAWVELQVKAKRKHVRCVKCGRKGDEP